MFFFITLFCVKNGFFFVPSPTRLITKFSSGAFQILFVQRAKKKHPLPNNIRTNCQIVFKKRVDQREKYLFESQSNETTSLVVTSRMNQRVPPSRTSLLPLVFYWFILPTDFLSNNKSQPAPLPLCVCVCVAAAVWGSQHRRLGSQLFCITKACAVFNPLDSSVMRRYAGISDVFVELYTICSLLFFLFS